MLILSEWVAYVKAALEATSRLYMVPVIQLLGNQFALLNLPIDMFV